MLARSVPGFSAVPGLNAHLLPNLHQGGCDVRNRPGAPQSDTGRSLAARRGNRRSRAQPRSAPAARPELSRRCSFGRSMSGFAGFDRTVRSASRMNSLPASDVALRSQEVSLFPLRRAAPMTVGGWRLKFSPHTGHRRTVASTRSDTHVGHRYIGPKTSLKHRDQRIVLALVRLPTLSVRPYSYGVITLREIIWEARPRGGGCGRSSPARATRSGPRARW